MNKKANLPQSVAHLSALMGHDLKQPARSVRQYSEMLQKTLAPHLDELPDGVAHKVEGHLSFLVAGSTRIHEMIESLMDVSKALYMASEETGDPLKCLRGVLDQMESSGELCGGEAMVKGGGSFPMARLNNHGLNLVWQNLLSNAVKFSRPDATPKIEVGYIPSDSGRATFYVKDFGIGIPWEGHNKVFDMFTRVNYESPGHGVGLALCKMILESVGGSIELAMSAPGAGSVFRFTIPEEVGS